MSNCQRVLFWQLLHAMGLLVGGGGCISVDVPRRRCHTPQQQQSPALMFTEKRESLKSPHIKSKRQAAALGVGSRLGRGGEETRERKREGERERVE